MKKQAFWYLYRWRLLGFMANGGAVSKGQTNCSWRKRCQNYLYQISTGQITQSARGTSSGAVNVNFTINTIDSRGFEKLYKRIEVR